MSQEPYNRRLPQTENKAETKTETEIKTRTKTKTRVKRPNHRFRSSHKARRVVTVAAVLTAIIAWVVNNPASYETVVTPAQPDTAEQTGQAATDGSATADGRNSATDGTIVPGDAQDPALDELGDPDAQLTTGSDAPLARDLLEQLEVKGRAPKTGYSRDEFYSSWPLVDGCNLRQRIIKREFGDTAVLDECDVVAGEFTDPYTGEHKVFASKAEISKGVQIDHVVALSDAWQKGAQYLPQETRYAMATDPLNLLAVDASANQQKSDGDAATWLPKNKAFRCTYVARQVSVKYKYGLWVTTAEKTAIADILATCPTEPAVGV